MSRLFVSRFSFPGPPFWPHYSFPGQVKEHGRTGTARADYLNFNAELISMSKKIGDYVIIHELLHFSVPNHGRLWKSLMRAHLGDYEMLEVQINRITKKNLTNKDI